MEECSSVDGGSFWLIGCSATEQGDLSNLSHEFTLGLFPLDFYLGALGLVCQVD